MRHPFPASVMRQRNAAPEISSVGQSGRLIVSSPDIGAADFIRVTIDGAADSRP